MPQFPIFKGLIALRVVSINRSAQEAWCCGYRRFQLQIVASGGQHRLSSWEREGWLEAICGASKVSLAQVLLLLLFLLLHLRQAASVRCLPCRLESQLSSLDNELGRRNTGVLRAATAPAIWTSYGEWVS
jgi:hypothetical protein